MSIKIAKHPAFILVLTVMGCGGNSESPDNTAPAPKVQAVPRDTVKVINGHDKDYSPEGWLRMEGDRKDGQRHGIWTSYTPKGAVKSRNEYRDGKLEGLTTVFRDNGAMYYSGQYRNDKQVGSWRFYDEQGNLAKMVQYDTLGNIVRQP